MIPFSVSTGNPLWSGPIFAQKILISTVQMKIVAFLNYRNRTTIELVKNPTFFIN